jgi:hypothetical protein
MVLFDAHIKQKGTILFYSILLDSTLLVEPEGTIFYPHARG